MDDRVDWMPACPRPLDPFFEPGARVRLAHGGGGELMRRLITGVFAGGFADPALDTDHDAALVSVGGERVAFTTDSYVVSPRFFPGGDIGLLAVNGTVNDLAMRGARPLFLSAAFVLEEGLPVDELARVVRSMRGAAVAAGVHIVTGDTKVVERGKGDGVFINTAGIGLVPPGVELGPGRVCEGDAVLVSGDIARHGMAIMSAREGLGFESSITSDCAPLSLMVRELLDAGLALHCLRDATRGGLATAVIEIAHSAGLDVELRDTDIPVADPVRAACELLGLDPLYVANEGCMVVFVAAADADRALAVMRRHSPGARAVHCGVTGGPGGRVTLRTALGTSRVLDLLSGEPLPRIC